MIWCKDCKHCKLYREHVNSTCRHPTAIIAINYYDGNHKYRASDDMRTTELWCGVEAKLFEQAPVKRFSSLAKLFGYE